MAQAKPAADAEEQALLDRARSGEQEAFERLVEAHLPKVWSVVWRMVRHSEDCEDVVQEVFLTAWQSLAAYRGDCRLSTWLHSIAVTRALNHLDRVGERMRRTSISLEPREDDDGTERTRGAASKAIVSTQPTPLQSLEASDLARRLSECLDRLPPNWRAVVSLRDGEEQSYEEISRVLGLALGTVRSRLARARLALRQCIEGAPA